jgi:hypothetical protein
LATKAAGQCAGITGIAFEHLDRHRAAPSEKVAVAASSCRAVAIFAADR